MADDEISEEGRPLSLEWRQGESASGAFRSTSAVRCSRGSISISAIASRSLKFDRWRPSAGFALRTGLPC